MSLPCKGDSLNTRESVIVGKCASVDIGGGSLPTREAPVEECALLVGKASMPDSLNTRESGRGG